MGRRLEGLVLAVDRADHRSLLLPWRTPTSQGSCVSFTLQQDDLPQSPPAASRPLSSWKQNKTKPSDAKGFGWRWNYKLSRCLFIYSLFYFLVFNCCHGGIKLYVAGKVLLLSDPLRPAWLQPERNTGSQDWAFVFGGSIFQGGWRRTRTKQIRQPSEADDKRLLKVRPVHQSAVKRSPWSTRLRPTHPITERCPPELQGCTPYLPPPWLPAAISILCTAILDISCKRPAWTMPLFHRLPPRRLRLLRPHRRPHPFSSMTF